MKNGRTGTEKRKTHTSSEVKARFNKKTYQQYTFSLKKKEDAEYIEYIENERAKGYSTPEIIKELIRKNK